MGIQNGAWVKDPLDLPHQVELALAVLVYRVVALESSEAVLSRYRAAQFDGVREQSGCGRPNEISLTVLEYKGRMEVPVPGVAHNGDSETGLGGETVNSIKNRTGTGTTTP